MNSPLRTGALLGALVLWVSTFPAGATVDADGDGMSDLWEQLHGVDDPTLDPDGDGFINWVEAGFRTNPNVGGEGLNRMPRLGIDSANGQPIATVIVDTVEGVRYQVQRAAWQHLPREDWIWTNLGAPFVGPSGGGVITIPADDEPLVGGSPWYFRVQAVGFADTDDDDLDDNEENVIIPLLPPLDTDGDGMSDDWENMYGLNPNDPNDGGLDPDGDGLTNAQEAALGTNPGAADHIGPVNIGFDDALTGAEEINFRDAHPSALYESEFVPGWAGLHQDYIEIWDEGNGNPYAELQSHLGAHGVGQTFNMLPGSKLTLYLRYKGRYEPCIFDYDNSFKFIVTGASEVKINGEALEDPELDGEFERVFMDDDDWEKYIEWIRVEIEITAKEASSGLSEISLFLVPDETMVGSEDITYGGFVDFITNDDPDLPPPLVASFDESTGMRIRRIAMDGQPIPDTKEQAKDESDETNEETYVDSLTRQLRHDTSDIYVPLPGGELALAVKRSIRPEMWTESAKGVYGDHPGTHSGVDRPFGLGWDSGLAACLRTEYYEGDWSGSPPPRTYVHAMDESGNTHRFSREYLIAAPPDSTLSIEELMSLGRVKSVFLPMPANRTELSSAMDRLEATYKTVQVNGEYVQQVDEYILTRQFGTKVFYEGTPTITKEVALDSGETRFKVTLFHRILRVEDRFGNVLTYQNFPGESLIPGQIVAVSGGQPSSTRTLNIQQTDGRVDAVTDPRGKTWTYSYNTATSGGQTYHTLRSVTTPLGTRVDYGYHTTSMVDNAPQSPGTKEPPDTIHHLLLDKITTNIGSIPGWSGGQIAADSSTTRVFCTPDHSVKIPALLSGDGLFWTKQYVPFASRTPVVSRIDLADGHSTHFTMPGGDTTPQVELTASLAPNDSQVSGWTVNGTRSINITDAEGSTRRIQYPPRPSLTARRSKKP